MHRYIWQVEGMASSLPYAYNSFINIFAIQSTNQYAANYNVEEEELEGTAHCIYVYVTLSHLRSKGNAIA